MQSISASFLINLTGAFLAFLLQTLLTRVMNTEQYGIYVYVFTWISVASFLPRMGLDTCLLRYLAEYRAKGQWYLFFGIIDKSIDITKKIGIIVAVLSIILITFYSRNSYIGFIFTFIIGSISIPFMSLSKIYQSAIQSTFNEVFSPVPNILLIPFLTYVIILTIHKMNIPINSFITISVYTLSLIISCIIMIIILKRNLRKIHIESKREYNTKEWICTTMPIFFMSFLYILLNRIDIIMTGWLLGARYAGLYSVSTLVASLISFGFIAAHTTISPKISQLYYAKNVNDLQIILRESMKTVLVMTILTLCFILFFGKFILSIFGEEFVYYYKILAILSIGQVLFSFMGFSGLMMIVSGYQIFAANLLLLFVIIDLILNFFLIKNYGIYGAAYSNIIIIIMLYIYMYIFIKRKLHIDTSVISLFY